MTTSAPSFPALPDVPTLRDRVRAQAVLEALRSEPSRWGRADSFEVRENGWEVFVSRNGAGDEFSITFAPEGAVVRVFSHESEVSPYAFSPVDLYPGLLDGLPAALRPLVLDPAFDAGFDEGHLGVPAATMYLWRTPGDDAWRTGTAVFAPGANEVSGMLGGLGSAEEYLADSFVDDLSLEALEHLYASRPITQELLASLGSERLLADVLAEVAATGYPVA